MKTCPFCKEQIFDDAVKCRFCHSMLLPGVSQPASGGLEKEEQDKTRITYVVDRDLVRFAKFSGAVLAVFLVVGAYLFGFKLESALDEVKETQKDLGEAQESVATAKADLTAALKTVNDLKTEVESVLAAAEESLKEINARQKEAVEIVFSMRELSPPGEQALVAAKEEQPDKFRLGSKLKLWANGAVIRVRFLGGNADEQERVKAIALEWTKHANLTFAFGTSAEAEVRISFDPNGGSWSYQGTDALGISKDQPTMNLGWVTAGNTLHEFGHVLGLIEEHCNPSAHIRWNKTAVYDDLERPPNFWTKEQIDRAVFCKGVATDIGAYREFDPTSIMNMTFPGNYTEGLVLGGSEALSDSDKVLAARLYPKEG